MAKTSRRGFLAAFSAFAGAGATGATIAMAGPAAPAEHPDLLALGDRLDAALARFDVVDQRKRDARVLYERIRPDIPAELLQPAWDHSAGLYEQETDADGKTVWPPEPPLRRPRRFLTSEAIRRTLPHMDGRTRAARALKAKRPIALRYEQAVEDAKALVGWDEVCGIQCNACRDVRVLADETLASSAVTPAGLQVKARAIIALDRSRDGERVFHNADHMNALAAEILAVTARPTGGEP